MACTTDVVTPWEGSCPLPYPPVCAPLAGTGVPARSTITCGTLRTRGTPPPSKLKPACGADESTRSDVLACQMAYVLAREVEAAEDSVEDCGTFFDGQYAKDADLARKLAGEIEERAALVDGQCANDAELARQLAVEIEERTGLNDGQCANDAEVARQLEVETEERTALNDGQCANDAELARQLALDTVESATLFEDRHASTRLVQINKAPGESLGLILQRTFPGARTVISEVAPQSRAFGLLVVNDVLLKVNGQVVRSPEDAAYEIKRSGELSLEVQSARGDRAAGTGGPEVEEERRRLLRRSLPPLTSISSPTSRHSGGRTRHIPEQHVAQEAARQGTR